jgi:hypothetical protein
MYEGQMYENHVKWALERAESKLTPRALAVPGFTGLKIRHLLNNLGSLSSLNYLEIGVHKGGTFVSTMYGNQLNSAVAVDNWSEFPQGGASRREFFQNCGLLTSPWKAIEKDCFTLGKEDFPDPITLYLYDGCHSYETQYKALTYFYEMLGDEFIFMVDDFDWEDSKRGTRDSIRDLKCEILFEQGLTTGIEGDGYNWWNGFYVGVLKKSHECKEN